MSRCNLPLVNVHHLSGTACSSALALLGFPRIVSLALMFWPILGFAEVQVISATYGSNCSAPRDNAKAHLAAACDRKYRCDYIVDYRILGDPAPGCAKAFVAEWSCGAAATPLNATVPPEAGYEKHIVLSCPDPRQGQAIPRTPIPPDQATVSTEVSLVVQLAGASPAPAGTPINISWQLTNTTILRTVGVVEVMLDNRPLSVRDLPSQVDLLPQEQTGSQFSLLPQQPGTHSLSVRYSRDTGRTIRRVLPGGQVVTEPHRELAGTGRVEFVVAGLIADNDRDGIEDAEERRLLEMYRPDLLFSVDDGDETFRPTDPWWYLQRSELLSDGDQDGSPLVPIETLRQDPNAILISPNGKGSADITKSPAQSDFHINPKHRVEGESSDDPAYHGNPWPQAGQSHHIGLYGHVVPVKLTDPFAYDFHKTYDGSAQGETYYKIEYWQFFGYSSANKPFNIADHEGDWTSVQLIVHPQQKVPKSVFHFAHGILFRFDITAQNNARNTEFMGPDGQIREYKGHPNYNFASKALDLADLVLGSGNPKIVKNANNIAKAQNNVLRLLKDPTTGDFTHPVVYVERGTHEFYPSEWWSYYGAPNHNGQGYHYLTSTPPNLGEVEFPLSEDRAANLVLRFNGLWGTYNNSNDPPPGPSLHLNWLWPANSSLRWQIATSMGF